MHPDWARALRDQCQATDVAFFFKPHDAEMVRVGKTAAGRLLDGRMWDEFPRRRVRARAVAAPR
jgi:protein gp37